MTHSDKQTPQRAWEKRAWPTVTGCMWQPADCPAVALTLAREPDTRTESTGICIILKTAAHEG